MTEMTVSSGGSVARRATVVPFPVAVPPTKAPPEDTRYRRLLGERNWAALPAAVRRRFSRYSESGDVTIYRGEVVATELSTAGWLLAEIARVAGGPLPFVHGATGPALVIVSEAPELDGQIWSRNYPRSRAKNGWAAFPQTIHSAKRFAGPTGLEEILGRVLGVGIVMRLTLAVEDGTLVFRSAGYVLEVGSRVIELPRVLSPGRCEVRHRPETDGRFSFTLSLVHPRLGRLIHQVAFFSDDASA